jgi:hypothetical protein
MPIYFMTITVTHSQYVAINITENVHTLQACPILSHI